MIPSKHKHVSRRSTLKTLGTLGASFTLPVGTAVAHKGPHRTVILGGKKAVEANAEGTDDRQFSRRGSWLVEGDADGNGGDDKLSLWIDPTEPPFNLGSFTLDQLDSIKYHTYTDHPITGSTPENVYINIYTEPDGTNDDASWYGYRLSWEPYLSNQLSAPADQWNTWSTDPGKNQLTFYDSNRDGVPFGFYGQPDLQDLQAGPIDWSDYIGSASPTSIDYGQETVKAIVFSTGSGWSDTFLGYFDAIAISTKTGPGKSGKGIVELIDLEP